jgi:hypothetical protein
MVAKVAPRRTALWGHFAGSWFSSPGDTWVRWQVRSAPGVDVSCVAGKGKSSVRYVAACIFVALIGFYVVFKEARPYFQASGSDRERFERLAADAPDLPLSISGTRLVLSTCLHSLHNLYGRLQTSQDRNALSANCSKAAAQTIASSPADAFAHAARAKFLFQMQDTEAANDFMIASHLIAPHENWIALWRWLISEDHFDDLSEANRQYYVSDIKLVMQRDEGIVQVARRYFTSAHLRERMEPILASVPLPTQGHFLALVRSLAATDSEQSGAAGR